MRRRAPRKESTAATEKRVVVGDDDSFQVAQAVSLRAHHKPIEETESAGDCCGAKKDITAARETQLDRYQLPLARKSVKRLVSTTCGSGWVHKGDSRTAKHPRALWAHRCLLAIICIIHINA